ncbi:MAG: methionyl-tRNA formyltransferase [Bacteroidales bacterium]|nr:methionyl-tRNA formyltransferase [Bacteroidales bacterium]
MRPKIVFMGTPDFAVSSLDALCKAGCDVAAVVTVPDRPTGRGLKLTFSPVKSYALEHSIEVLQPERLRDEAFLARLQAIGADMFVVVAFRMLPQCVWAMPRLGTFNLHASLLPQYRGAAPINWAIINGETTTGVTTFLLNERIDEGRILLQESTPITPADTAGTMHDRLAEIGCRLVVTTVEGLADGTLTPTEQPSFATLYGAPKIFKQDCAIDWNSAGRDIVNFVRGLSPYPAATMAMKNEKGEILSFKVYDVAYETDANSVKGTVTTDKKRWLKIGITDGYINILSLQLSGKRKNSVDEFLRGYDVSNWSLVC